MTDWHTDTQTHTDGKINEQIFWQYYIIQKEREREHQGKRQFSSSRKPTKDGLSFSAI